MDIGEIINTMGVWNTIFLLLAIISIVLSIYLHYNSRNISIPTFDSESNRLLENKIKDDGDLQIIYKGKQVDRITETKFAFWNNGRSVINNNDIAPKDPLCIDFKNSSLILKCEVTYVTSEVNNFQAIPRPEKGIIEFTFDYLGEGEGGIITFLHTSEENGSLKLKGTIKGVKKITKYNNKRDGLINWAFDNLLFWIDPILEKLPKKIEFIGIYLAVIVSLPIIMIFGIPQMLLAFYRRFFKKKSLIEIYNESKNQGQKGRSFKKTLDIQQ
jgi:hypothetical protein